MLNTVVRTCALIMISGSACSQGAARPGTGLWDLTITTQAAFMNRAPVTEQRCLNSEAVSAFNKFFTAMPPDDKGNRPTCQLTDMRVGDGSSSWKAQCDGARGKVEGVGASTFTESSYNAKQTFKIGPMEMTTAVLAKRVGPC